jgi:hypothetical protein
MGAADADDEESRRAAARARRDAYREELRAQIERNAGRRAQSRLGRLAAEVEYGPGGLPEEDMGAVGWSGTRRGGGYSF